MTKWFAHIVKGKNWTVLCRPAVSEAVEVEVTPLLPVHRDALLVRAVIAALVTNRVYKGIALFRIGFGYDAHRLLEGRPLVLGGVEIPHPLGLDGHSDADVLTHAVIDALIGALGMGDIGRHFPDIDPAYKGMESLSMLEKVMEWVRRDQCKVNNLDTTIVAETPKLAPYLPAMEKNLAGALETSHKQINIKATTTEGMGFCGRQEGIAAYAVVSLVGIQTPPD